MKVKNRNWYMVIWILAMNCEEYRFLMADVCRFRNEHPKVKSIKRCARYVLIHHYSTAFMAQLAFIADNIDEFVEWRKSNVL